MEVGQLRVERTQEEVQLSAQLQFELPSVVEEALLKGIPMYFVAEVDVLQDRWYWYDKKITTTHRYMRLSYQALTQRWRLNFSTAIGADAVSGMALSQSYDTLAEALSVIKRLSRWKVLDVADLDRNQKYKIEFRFRLDLTQLPRPFQIGALGQAEWELAATARAAIPPDTSK